MWTMFLQLIGVIAALAAGGWVFINIVDYLVFGRAEDNDEG